VTFEQPQTGIRAGLPAYFYPWPGSAHWRGVAALPPGSVLVLDPADGPGRAADPRYTEAVERTRSQTDARVYGYVDTAYGLRPIGEILTDAGLFQQWYGIDGVFLDRVLPMMEQLDYYTSVATALRQAVLEVALNPGQPVMDSLYFALADHIVVFEGTYDHYLATAFPEPPRGEALATSWHLVYDVLMESTMREVVALARERGAGLLFVTDGSMPNPWDRLPAYWTQQVDVLAEDD
jgi:hypothetical protein